MISCKSQEWNSGERHSISTGPFSRTTISAVGYFSTPGVDKLWPNMQAVFFPIGLQASRMTFRSFTELGKIIDSYHKTQHLIHPEYFENKEDMKSLVAGINVTLKVFDETQELGQYGARFADKAFPGCEKDESRSDEYFECHARHFTGTTWHPIETCRMVKSLGDPVAVVDSELRSIGVKNLRVADASVMPEIRNGNLNAPTIMIGERAADLILKTWNKTKNHACSLNL